MENVEQVKAAALVQQANSQSRGIIKCIVIPALERREEEMPSRQACCTAFSTAHGARSVTLYFLQ
jgi:hypothetical protein